MAKPSPSTPVLAVSCRMLRSPSHESFTTDNSLFSISTLALDTTASSCSHTHNKATHRSITFRELRCASPHPESGPVDSVSKRTFDIIPEGMWFEESNDLIRSCAALSATLGIQKSFSTSDITQLPCPDREFHTHTAHGMSELALNSLQRCGYMLDNPRLEHASRSCSTWVAVGELASTSQLPSPHGGPATTTAAGMPLATNNSVAVAPPPPAFTAADLIRSVNKKVRQNYIRRRLLTTYRAIERLSQSEFNLDRLEAEAAAATELLGPGPTELVVPSSGGHHVAAPDGSEQQQQAGAKLKAAKISIEAASMKNNLIAGIAPNNITIDDIEKERGKPLSKYDRNMMIFNWLHSLDEEVLEDELEAP